MTDDPVDHDHDPTARRPHRAPIPRIHPFDEMLDRQRADVERLADVLAVPADAVLAALAACDLRVVEDQLDTCGQLLREAAGAGPDDLDRLAERLDLLASFARARAAARREVAADAGEGDR